ncbi:hypothetical protein HOP60_05035 [Halomonas daqingensis]|uniref:Uncharacterized protein n=1 Tax=Billgrantia desiderata TaxID=52021 RepID=A0ABS9B353_9GAMM|nr:Gmad2 immunoglobulin-like domain-containing protein [Halomonas desiderata]MCE8041521.1 hypothetical protein [Halomonas desiderata]MCE8046096.1 hypothetical protein [Halomonas desiderata]
MKSSVYIKTAAIAAMLTLGFASQASAMTPSSNFELQNGKTTSRLMPGTDHYRFEVVNSSQLRVASQRWNPESAGGRVQAQLRDSNGNVVARSNARGGDFILEQNLAPGRYVLEVRATQLGGRQESTQRYYLTTELR